MSRKYTKSLAEYAIEYIEANGPSSYRDIAKYIQEVDTERDTSHPNFHMAVHGKINNQPKRFAKTGKGVFGLVAKGAVPVNDDIGKQRAFAGELADILGTFKIEVNPQNTDDLIALLKEFAEGQEPSVKGTLIRLMNEGKFADSQPAPAPEVKNDDIVVTPAMERAVIEKMDAVREDDEVYDVLEADGSNFYQELAYGVLDNDKSIDEQIAEVKADIKAKKEAETTANAKAEVNATEKAKQMLAKPEPVGQGIELDEADFDNALDLLSNGKARKHIIHYESGNGSVIQYVVDHLEKAVDEDDGSFKGYYVHKNDRGILVQLRRKQIVLIEQAPAEMNAQI